MLRYYGHLPSGTDERDYPAGALLFDVEQTLPEQASLARFAKRDFYQEPTNTCVSWAADQALWVFQGSVLGKAEAQRVLFSPGAAYYHALRRQHGPTAPLFDLGCRPRDLWAALRETGPVGWDAWPFRPTQPGQVLQAPPWDAYQTALSRDWLSYWWVWQPGDWRVLEVKRAIASGRPGTCAIVVDEAFERLGPGETWPGRTGTMKGRHDLTIVGFEPGRFQVVNSWMEWGDENLGWIAEAALASDETSDIIIPELAR